MLNRSQSRISAHKAQLYVVAAFFALFVGTSTASAQPLGDCSAEAQLGGRNDVVFCEPWESDLWWKDHGFAETDRDPLDCATVINAAARQQCFDTNTHPAVSSSSVVSQVSPGVPCVSGSCLRVSIPQGDLGSFTTKWLFEENTGQTPEQVFYRYYIRVSDDWDPASCSAGDVGGKLPGLSHTKTTGDPEGQCGNGGNRPTSTSHCWSMRAMHKGCVDGGRNVCAQDPMATWQYGSYLYFPGQQTNTGSNGMWHDGLNHWSSTSGSGGSCGNNPNNVSCGVNGGGMLRPGRWYEVEMMVNMNTPGQSNGIVRGWVDGALSFEKTNMVFRENGHDEIHVREAWLNVFMGGSQGACADIEVYLDQMVLATDARIGATSSTPVVRPEPPSDLVSE